MNIRKLEDLSKDELIELIKQEREACIKHVPISVEERLPEAMGEHNPWSDDVIVYTESGDCHVGCFVGGDWIDHHGFDIENPTHWLPIPEIEE